MKVNILKTVVTDITDHQKTGGHRQSKGRVTNGIERPFVFDRHPNKARQNSGRRRAWQPLKITFVLHGELGIKARQSERSARRMDKHSDPATLTKTRQGPRINHQGRRHAKGNHIGQAIVLRAKSALSIRQTGHPTVEPIEDHGNENQLGSHLKLAVHRRCDGIKPSKESRCC